MRAALCKWFVPVVVSSFPALFARGAKHNSCCWLELKPSYELLIQQVANDTGGRSSQCMCFMSLADCQTAAFNSLPHITGSYLLWRFSKTIALLVLQ
jgi:hypothetical protein